MLFDFNKARSLKLFGGTINQAQVDSVNAIVAEVNKQRVTDKRQAGYMLATAYHECYNPKKPETRLTPMVEFGGEAYLQSKKYYPYYGRGFSQLTWVDNYRKESKRLGIDLTTQPQLMLRVDIAANSHVYCMANGTYTGKKVGDYINDEYINKNGLDAAYRQARRVVNGVDKAETIAGYATLFQQCLVDEPTHASVPKAPGVDVDIKGYQDPRTINS